MESYKGIFVKDILEHFVSPYGNLLTFIITIWAIQSYCNPNSQLSLKVILREIVLVLAIILICIRFYAIEELVYYDKDALDKALAYSTLVGPMIKDMGFLYGFLAKLISKN